MKRFLLLLLFPCLLFAQSVVMVIANMGFRDEELFVTKRVLEQGGVKVTVASNDLSVASGMLGGKVKPDMLYTDIDPSKFDGIVFVGGVGASIFWNDQVAHRLAREFLKKGKVVAAICIAPVTLARAGILKGRKCTVWPGERREVERMGCIYQGEGVVVDGRVVTAAGPPYAKDFGRAILRLLKGVK